MTNKLNMTEHITHREFQDAILSLATKRELETWGGALIGRMDAQFEGFQLHMDFMRRNMEAIRRLSECLSAVRPDLGQTSGIRTKHRSRTMESHERELGRLLAVTTGMQHFQSRDCQFSISTPCAQQQHCLLAEAWMLRPEPSNEVSWLRSTREFGLAFDRGEV
jgi:hypothetical protein